MEFIVVHIPFMYSLLFLCNNYACVFVLMFCQSVCKYLVLYFIKGHNSALLYSKIKDILIFIIIHNPSPMRTEIYCLWYLDYNTRLPTRVCQYVLITSLNVKCLHKPNDIEKVTSKQPPLLKMILSIICFRNNWLFLGFYITMTLTKRKIKMDSRKYVS